MMSHQKDFAYRALIVGLVVILLEILPEKAFSLQSNQHSSIPPRKQIKVNQTIPLNTLKHIFDPANCSDGRTTCKSLFPAEVSDFLKHQLYRSVDRLCLIIKPVLGGHFSEREIHLESLTLFPSLTRLHIMSEHQFVSKARQVRIYYPSNFTTAMTLQQLHITIAIRTWGVSTLAPFISTLRDLQVLDLGQTLEINENNDLVKVISALEGKPLLALSLRSFQNVAFYHFNFIQLLNMTEFLWPLRNSPLQYLDLSGNQFVEFTPDILAVTKNLRILDISQNELLSSGNMPMFIQLFIHPSLEVVMMNDQGCAEGLQNRDFMEQSFHLKKDKIQVNAFSNSIFTDYDICKRKLGINGTAEREKHNFCELLKCMLPKYLKDIPCSALPAWSDIFPLNFTCRDFIKYPIAKNLKEMIIANVNSFSSSSPATKGNVLCVTSNNVQKIVLSRNRKLLEGISFEQEIKYTRLTGFEQLSYLDISSNGLTFPLQNVMIQSFPQLQYLYLGGNFITTNNSNICRSNKLLKLLDLSRNSLNTTVDLTGCHYLEKLDVSHNNLGDLFSELSTIRFLNASNNRINKLSPATIKSLKNLGLKLSVTVDLSNNPWDCGCSKESLDSIEFMQAASQYNVRFHDFLHYQCYGFGSYSFLSNVIVRDLTSACNSSHIVIYIQAFTVITSLVLIILIFYLCYRCRYRINTCYFHTCRRIHRADNKPANSRIKYDAFVSYSAEDRFWVHDVLRPELEGEYGFKLCLHYRDFPAHGDLADVIIDEMRQSRSLLVVLSRFSVVKPWCDYELKQAHVSHLHTGQDLIIIKLGDIPSDLQVTDLVQDLLHSQVYIQWPEVGLEPSPQDKRQQSVFWSKIQKALYGRDYCECFRYFNPLYRRNDPLRVPLLQAYSE